MIVLLKNIALSDIRTVYVLNLYIKQLPRRPQQRLKKKTIGLMIKTTALHVHHAF